MNKPKVVVVLGQTATGKSDIGVMLAKKFNGEIISADSRQVYKGLDIGSGKITKKEMLGVPHHLLDVVSPKSNFTVVQFKKKAQKVIKDILKRGKLPIIVGGTAFYIDALIYDLDFPEVKENKSLRKKLEAFTTEELFVKLEKLDKNRAEQIDKHNKIRLIRALEIIDTLGKIPKVTKNSPYDVLKIGLVLPKEDLHENIHKRLFSRMKKGMLSEVKKIHENGVSWKKLESLGLEYRYLALYLQGKIKKDEMLQKLETEIKQFSKRQMTWFKKDTSTIWLKPTETSKLVKTIKTFLKN